MSHWPGAPSGTVISSSARRRQFLQGLYLWPRRLWDEFREARRARRLHARRLAIEGRATLAKQQRYRRASTWR